jgi:hypothetical protein
MAHLDTLYIRILFGFACVLVCIRRIHSLEHCDLVEFRMVSNAVKVIQKRVAWVMEVDMMASMAS